MARPRINPKVEITDEEIMSYDNVPVKVAAEYIGWSAHTLYYAIQDGRAPFGFASVNEDASTYSGCSYTYNISPGLLVAYKRGTLACPQPGEVMRVILTAVQDMLAEGKIIKIPTPVPVGEMESDDD